MKKTKIVATIGPSSEKKEVLKGMIENGLNVIRINMSHALYEEMDIRIKLVHELNEEMNTHTGILVDTKGPELRTGLFDTGEATLVKDSIVEVTSDEVLGNNTILTVKYPNLYNDINVGNNILLNNGLIKLTVISKENNKILCRVENTGVIKNKRSVNLPQVKYSTPFLSDKDIEDITYAAKRDVDFLALSFVSSKEDVLETRELIEKCGNKHLQIISKIENQYAIDNIDEILEVSDGIMVARGDLGVEFDMEKLPSLQKHLAFKCQQAKKTCIVATEMLASMESSVRPTRAEVSDVANAVFEGVDAVMLSGETALGLYPVDTVSIMSKIIADAEDNKHLYGDELDHHHSKKDVTDSIVYAGLEISSILKPKAIVVTTMSGYTAHKMSHYRPNTPIIAMTPNIYTAKKLILNYGVYPILTDKFDSIDHVISKAKEVADNMMELDKNDKIIVIGGMPLGETKQTNFIKVEGV